jgi:predicted nucleotidyltransferase
MIDAGILLAIVRWSESKPQVMRTWVFGSRVRGDNRPDSDLDIGIEVSANERFDDFGVFYHHEFAWMEELRAVTGFYIHLSPWFMTGRALKFDIPPEARMIYEAATAATHNKQCLTRR